MEGISRPEWVDSIMVKLKERDQEVARCARVGLMRELMQQILAAHENGDLSAVADWLDAKIEMELEGE